MKKIALDNKQKKIVKKAAIVTGIIGGTFIILKILEKTKLGENLCDFTIEKLVYLKGTKFHCQYYAAAWYNKDIPEDAIAKIHEFTNETLQPYFNVKVQLKHV